MSQDPYNEVATGDHLKSYPENGYPPTQGEASEFDGGIHLNSLKFPSRAPGIPLSSLKVSQEFPLNSLKSPSDSFKFA